MPSKRAHAKSRRGCRQCKQRHIKCDEISPCCGSCSKKGLECEYQEYFDVERSMQILTQQSYDTPGSKGQSITTRSTPEQAPILGTGFSITDVLLMHHYTLYTSQTIGVLDEVGIHEFWRTRVPPLAHNHPFLMHALLSTASAHQASLGSPSQGALKVARQHYGKAIADFNTNRHLPTAEYADAAFCFCMLTMMITWALECSSQQDDPISGAADLLEVIRTAIGMLSTSQPDLKHRDITRHMWHLRVEPETFPVPQEIAASISSLSAAVSAQGYTQEENDALQDACMRLRSFFTIVPLRPSTCIYILRWPARLPALYLKMLRNHDPAALAILAHWCVPIHHAPSPWYVGRWPGQIVCKVSEMLSDTVWEQALRWPVAEVASSPMAR